MSENANSSASQPGTVAVDAVPEGALETDAHAATTPNTQTTTTQTRASPMAAPTSAPASTNPNDPELFVEKLTRHWARGEVKTFLEGHLEGYRKARQQSNTRARDYLSRVINEFFVLVPWRNKVSDPVPAKDDPIRSQPPEQLTEAETLQKARKVAAMENSIERWLKGRIESTRIAGRPGNKENDVWTRIAKQLAGLSPSKPKKLSATQRWSKDHYEKDVKSDFEARWAIEKDRLGAKHHAQFRETVTTEHFKKLSKDEQDRWAKKATDDHDTELTKWKAALEAPTDTSPEGRQKAIDTLLDFTGPFLEAIAEATGWNASLITGGPEPRRSGRINIISTHMGKNLATKPLNWRTSDEQKWKVVNKFYLDYLETCYTKEMKESCALPDSQNKTVTKEVLDSLLTLPEHSDEQDQQAEPGASKIAADVPSVPQRAPSSSHRESPSKPARNASSKIDDNAAPKKRREGKSKGKRKALPASSDKESEAADTSDTDSDAPAVQKLYNTRGRSSLTANHDAHASHTPDVHTASAADGTERPDPVTTDIPERASQSDSVAISTSLAPSKPATVVSYDSRHTIYNGFPATRDGVEGVSSIRLSNAHFLDDAPKWATLAFQYLQSPDPLSPADRKLVGKGLTGEITDMQGWSLPTTYTTLLEQYLALEKSSSFVVAKGSGGILDSQGRPGQIQWWISRGRALHVRPEIEDVEKFAIAWWGWWARLQPSWRQVSIPSASGSPPVPRHDDGEWHFLDKPGPNGLLSVIAALKWWGSETSEAAKDHRWLTAVDDVIWVMERIVRSRKQHKRPANEAIETKQAKRSRRR
ncbi:hypothetical protein CONPUDRAFT_157744 [Coniophora puteana RWD-64-598 SS2]|uniref:Uncharacterized protein n=1 Tax=Coniophora puteana (strain RWD-64-598) TaxID=741705 RepID=A0A5M3MBY7_CONPW|nr:uncharacterized protein CONPUDRAFT_157744 [Coniophora puteana RWD-64-598 SS2]EIW76557.1 hypothetical protein CONPUDRAFT_157744 [Coniophora puteana RWD-64-598 SS2]